MRRHRIALLGTFDLQNYGDLLFPLLTRHELGRRLGEVEILPFSYHAKKPPGWPFRVFAVEEFADRLGDIDAVVVGGGHVIRFDRAVAPGYEPGSAAIHHPTGLWLTPAFLAAASGRPVVWNAVGAYPDVEPWAAEIFGTVIEASTYVSVRDPASREAVRAVAPGADCAVVPDSAFGVRALLDGGEAEERFGEWRRQRGLDERPYVVVQGTDLLEPVADSLRRELQALADQGFAIVELPIGPVLGDRTGSVAPDWTDVVRIDPWPPPRLLAQIVGHAEAAVGQSLHLGITSLCHGVPLHRPRAWPGQKYEILTEFPEVYTFDEHGGEPPPSLSGRVGRGDPCPEVADRWQRLMRHWDRLAEALDGRRAPSLADRSGSWAPRSSRLSRTVFGSLNALAHASEAAEGRTVEDLLQRQLLEEAERRRERAEARLAELRRRTGEEREQFERDLEERSEQLSAAESALAEAERARAELQAVLDAIHGSRSWRLSTAFRRIGSALVSPWRRLREARRRRSHPLSEDFNRDSPEP